MEVLNDVLAPARLRRSRVGVSPKKTKDAWKAAAPCERHPGILNFCDSEELSASGANRPSVRRELPARPKCRLAELQRLSNDGFLVVSHAARKHDAGRHDHGDDDGALQTLHGFLSF